MGAVSYPSPAVPALPSVTLDAPESWSVEFSSPSIFSVVDTTGPEGAYRSNVVVSVTREATGMTLDDAARAIDGYVAQRPAFVAVSDDRVERAGSTWLRREYDVLGPSGAPDLRFVVLATIVENGVCSDQVRFTGTARSGTPGAVELLTAAIDSAKVVQL